MLLEDVSRLLEEGEQAQPSQPPPLKIFSVGETLAREYQVQKILGSGGGGIVYLCVKDAKPDELLAVKVPHVPSLSNSEDLARFHEEGHAARRVKSPFVVQTHDLLLDDGLFALIMEYVPGRSLATLIEEHREHAQRLAWRILTQIACGLAAIHAYKIIHYDLKPSNVLLDEHLNCRISDFGIARLLSRKAGRKDNSDLIGTIDYVSPEVVEGKAADARSDIYAWGTIGYELLTGRLPFQAPSPYARLLAKATKIPPSISSICPEASPALARIVTKALQRKPSARPDSATLVWMLLEDCPPDERPAVEAAAISTASLPPQPPRPVSSAFNRAVLSLCGKIRRALTHIAGL